MRTFRIYTLLLICCISSTANVGLAQTTHTTDRESDDLNGPVNTVVEKSAGYENSFGKWKEVGMSVDEKKSYNRSGNLIEKSVKDEDGIIFGKTIYEYDSKGTVVTTKTVSTKGSVILLSKYTYLDDHKLDKVKAYDDKGKLYFQNNYYYNTEGQVEKKEEFNEKGEIEKKIFYTYNSKNQLYEEKSSGEKSYDDKSTYYSYDSLGYLCEIKEYGSSTYPQKHLAYYNDSNGNDTLSRDYGVTGRIQKEIVTKYDQYKNPISVDISENDYSNKSRLITIEYKYDKYGNWTTKKRYKKYFSMGEDVIEPLGIHYRSITYHSGK